MAHYLVTGATGVVGGALVNDILAGGDRVTALVRDRGRALDILPHDVRLDVVEAELASALEELGAIEDLDYVVHSAAPTRGSFFVERPVETIAAIVDGTAGMLRLARASDVRGMLYVSTMEVYGVPPGDALLSESDQHYVDPLAPRSSYPMAKRLAESLCAAYVTQYSTPVRIARLAQVIGRELHASDDRVLAEMARAAVDGRPIELATDGAAEQTLIGIRDAISGLLTVLHHGANGEAYNVANTAAFCSIRDLATLVVESVPGSRSVVRTGVGDGTTRFPPPRSIRLNTQKLESLGWRPTEDLRASLSALTQAIASRGGAS